jgi:RimJ/RimL family protein N-acetyltransferase
MLLGKRIRLRGTEPTDLPNFYRWMNDPEVIQNLLAYTPLSSVDEQNWFDTMMKAPKEEHLYVVEILEDNQWIPVGSTGFHALDWKNRSVEIGISIGEKKYWNRGYGRDTMRLMLQHAFKDLNLNRVYLSVFETNERAKKAYLASGFVEEGRLRQDIYKNGQYIDVFVMSVLRSEWQDVEV